MMSWIIYSCTRCGRDMMTIAVSATTIQVVIFGEVYYHVVVFNIFKTCELFLIGTGASHAALIWKHFMESVYEVPNSFCLLQLKFILHYHVNVILSFIMQSRFQLNSLIMQDLPNKWRTQLAHKKGCKTSRQSLKKVRNRWKLPKQV